MIRLLPFLLVLTACAPIEAITTSYRDPSVTIASSGRFEEARMAGEWFVVADFSQNRDPTVAGVFGQPRWSFEPRPGTAIGVAWPYRYPLHHLPFVESGIGRLEQKRRLFQSKIFHLPPVWILWVDEDFTSAVLGTPDGSFGAILNRSPKMRADRLAAAKEILAFNGYDLSKLGMTPQ